MCLYCLHRMHESIGPLEVVNIFFYFFYFGLCNEQICCIYLKFTTIDLLQRIVQFIENDKTMFDVAC